MTVLRALPTLIRSRAHQAHYFPPGRIRSSTRAGLSRRDGSRSQAHPRLMSSGGTGAGNRTGLPGRGCRTGGRLTREESRDSKAERRAPSAKSQESRVKRRAKPVDFVSINFISINFRGRPADKESGSGRRPAPPADRVRTARQRPRTPRHLPRRFISQIHDAILPWATGPTVTARISERRFDLPAGCMPKR